MSDMLEQLQALLGQAQTAGGWNTASQPLGIQGLAVPISVDTPKGKIRCYLSLSADAGSSPAALTAALQALDAQGYPLDFWNAEAKSWGGSRKYGRRW